MKFLALAFLIAFGSTNLVAQDWPQWNGPNRDGSVPQQNLLTTVPEKGLEVLWRKPVSFGYAGPVIADGKVFLLDYNKKSGDIINNPGKRDELTGDERVRCYSEDKGKLLWEYSYNRPYSVSYGGGPRATPSFHNGKLYVLGSEGDLTCLNAKDGEKVWHRQFKEEFGAPTPIWGHAGSPLVHDGMLICMVGGKDSMVVAFELATGKELWRSLDGKDAGYCPPTIINHGGVEQLMVWDPENISSLNPTDGSVYWQQPLKPGYGMSILPPIKEGNLLFTSGENSQSVMLKLDDSKPAAEVAWKGNPKTGLFLATSNGIFRNGHVYGADIRSGAVICARASDGKRMWQSALPTTGSDRGRGKAHGTAMLMHVKDDQYLILSETGAFISATMTPDGYNETGRFDAIKPTLKTSGRTVLWTYPAIANGKLFVRNDLEIVCYSLEGSEANN